MSGHTTRSSATRSTFRLLAAAAGISLGAVCFGAPAFADTTVSGVSEDQDPPGFQDTHTAYLTARTPVCTDSAARTWSVQWVVAHSADEGATVTGGLSGSIAGSSNATVSGTQNYTGAMASVTVSVTVAWADDEYTVPPEGYTGYAPVSLQLTVDNPCAPAPTTTTTTTTTTTLAPTTTAAATTTSSATTVPSATTAAPTTAPAATTSAPATTRATASTAVLDATGSDLPSTGDNTVPVLAALGAAALGLGIALRRRAARLL